MTTLSKTLSKTVQKKVSLHIGILRRLFPFLTFNSFCTVTNAFVFSNLDYCLPVWGCRPKIELDNIQYNITKFIASYFYSSKVLNKCLTLKNKKSKSIIKMYLNSTLEYNLIEKCNFLTTNERLTYYSLIQLYKMLKTDNGTLFSNVFSFKSSTSVTRNANNFTIIRHQSEAFKRSINYRLIKLWNDMPQDIQNTNVSLTKFKFTISQYIVGKRKDKFCYD